MSWWGFILSSRCSLGFTGSRYAASASSSAAFRSSVVIFAVLSFTPRCLSQSFVRLCALAVSDRVKAEWAAPGYAIRKPLGSDGVANTLPYAHHLWPQCACAFFRLAAGPRTRPASPATLSLSPIITAFSSTPPELQKQERLLRTHHRVAALGMRAVAEGRV